MKKLLTLLVSLLLVGATAAFAACTENGDGGNGGNGGNDQDQGQTGDDQNDDDDNTGDETQENATIADEALKVNLDGHDLYVTSIGQAADYDTLVTLLTNSKTVGLTEGEDFTANSTLSSSAVAAGDTVIIVAGASTKGMGGAGVDAASEIQRAQDFAARDDINIIVAQLGGSARRGETSDAIFAALCPAASVTLIVSSADNDGMFSNTWCASTPLYKYSRATNMADSWKFLLGVE